MMPGHEDREDLKGLVVRLGLLPAAMMPSHEDREDEELRLEMQAFPNRPQ